MGLQHFLILALMGPKGALRAKTGPFGVPGGPEEAQYQAKVVKYIIMGPWGLLGTPKGAKIENCRRPIV